MAELEVSAEKYIVGCMVKDFSYTNRLAGNIGLESKHFESSTVRTVWEIAQTLHGKGTDVDAASVIEAIEAEGKHLDAKSASTMVMSSMTIATSSQTLPLHMDTVLHKHSVREVKGLLKDAHASLESGDSLEGTMASVKHQLARAGKTIGNKLSINDRLKNMSQRYKNIRTLGCSGIKSRWHSIQQHTAGYPFGKITILGARPKMGKSTLALNEAVFSSLVEKVPTLVISLEMDAEELFEKAGSDIAEVDNMQLKRGMLSADEVDEFMKNGPEIITKAPLYVEDNPSQTVEQICSKIREYANEKGVKFVVIDYLQIISSSPSQRFQSKTYEIQHMTNEIRIAAKETGVAVLLLSQISRPPKSFENAGQPAPMPQMHDLKDSGAIEQDAYIIMFIGPCTVQTDGRPSWMMKNVDPCTVAIAANRGGSTGEIHMHFHKPYNKFISAIEYKTMRDALTSQVTGK